jgi:hypothetical protein
MKTIIATCAIVHNLIIDYELKNNLDSGYIEDEISIPNHAFTVIPCDVNQTDERRSNHGKRDAMFQVPHLPST